MKYRLKRSNCGGLKRYCLCFIALITLFICIQPLQGLRAQDERVFELRKYTTYDGKLGDLHERFSDHTNHLFVKHGMHLVAYWTPVDPTDASNTLIYVLAFSSSSARDAAFKAFRADPEWQKAYKASRKNGPIVKKIESTIMKATLFSPIQ
jgi:hypothetical protein